MGVLQRPRGCACAVWAQLLLVSGLVISMRTSDGLEGHSSEYCQWESFNASCAQNEVVLMTSARYGRMRVGRCVKKTYGTIGCQDDILQYADSRCSGRASCRIPVPDISVAGIHPCPDDLTSYLEVTYTCAKVVVGDYRQCRKQHYMMLPPSGGFIASHSAQEYGYGVSCPWRIQGHPGQRVNLTLYDFTGRSVLEDAIAGGAVQRTFCRKYALLQEEGKTRETPICGGLERVRNVYISEGPVLDIRMLPSKAASGEEVYFAIKYETIGCPRLPSRKDALVDQTETSATITCRDTAKKWHIRCEGSQWRGTIGNCTEDKDEDIWTMLTEDWSSPKGLLIVIGLGVALGTVIGVLLLVLVLLWFKRRKPPGGATTGEKKPYGESPHDPLRRNYTSSGVTSSSELNYSTGSTTTTTWGQHQRPLPVPYVDEEGGKRYSADYPCDTTLRRGGGGGEHTLTMPGSKSRGGGSHVYESPKFNRRDILGLDCDFETAPGHHR